MCGGMEVKREGEEWSVPEKTMGVDSLKENHKRKVRATVYSYVGLRIQGRPGW